MGTLLVAAFIQSELQCIVLPNQRMRTEFAGGCQKVSSADERGCPLFTAATELPFVPASPSPRRGGPDLRLAAPSECTIERRARAEPQPRTRGLLFRAGALRQGLAAPHCDDRPA